LSDLANCCENLTIEKLCIAVSDSPKALANRQLRCQSDEKTSCCYLCLSRPQCVISCKYLGTIQTDPKNLEVEKVEDAKTVSAETNGLNQTQTDAPYCSLCNIEMSQTRTILKIDGWKGPNPKLSDKELSLTVCLCPICGKVEFKSDGQ
jgi:hypothetical protein